MDSDKLIKALNTSRYTIELFQTPSDSYVIKYRNNKNYATSFSEPMKDYKMASYMFDLKADELDGN